MRWKSIELGRQVREARNAANLSQEELASRISAMFSDTFTRAKISNIENGKSATAVNIISAIAEILEADLEVGGCKIVKLSELPQGELTIMPQQLSLQFDVEYSFTAASFKLSSGKEDSILLEAVLRGGQPKLNRTIEAGGPKRATA
jgi:transcriptional regulator with XRE-family HTH domain